MELVEGPTLADHIVQGPISVDDVLLKKLARTTESAYEQSAIDRDLKPTKKEVATNAEGIRKVY